MVPTGLFNVGFWGNSETRLMDERTATEEFVLHGLGLETATAGRASLTSAYIDHLYARKWVIFSGSWNKLPKVKLKK